ncbi:hypothetical protein [Jiella marina]|uniref:hypothetical protein n=1 Tax=Jiella sp. LLJ827 TaxID=2917712 RepID=UPI0021016CDA|nr:hypothetical protein [Jiella sp. LLJ827]MCQ0987524.1 hypothetical protein [Jiella sp. LLJ827]
MRALTLGLALLWAASVAAYAQSTSEQGSSKLLLVAVAKVICSEGTVSNEQWAKAAMLYGLAKGISDSEQVANVFNAVGIAGASSVDEELVPEICRQVPRILAILEDWKT